MKIAFLMGRISTKLRKGLKNFCNRRGYMRLKNNNNEKSIQTRTQTQTQTQTSTASLGKRRRFKWVKICSRTRKLGRVGSPKKWVSRLRDAYVEMMLKLSNTGLVGLAGPVEGGTGFGDGRVKEYDEKVIQQVYNMVLAGQGQIAAW